MIIYIHFTNLFLWKLKVVLLTINQINKDKKMVKTYLNKMIRIVHLGIKAKMKTQKKLCKKDYNSIKESCKDRSKQVIIG